MTPNKELRDEELKKRFEERFTFRAAEPGIMGSILCFHQDTYPDEVLSFLSQEIHRAVEEEKKRVLAILTDEINLAHTTASGKTSRLTSAFNRVSSSQTEGENKIN